MPAINPTLIPAVAPGDLFTQLTTNTRINIRWLKQREPVFFEVFNRPLADIAVRQLILAKAVDQLTASMGKQVLYPFLVAPRVNDGTSTVDVPIGWIWDLNISLSDDWSLLRLAKIKRISGNNNDVIETGGTEQLTFSGELRLIFTGLRAGDTAETALLAVNYEIGSTLTYQKLVMEVVPSTEEARVLPDSEAQSVSGVITFKTMDLTELENQNFLLAVAPPTDVTDANHDGLFDTPASYEIVDAVPNDPAGDYQIEILKHGTGLLADSAWNGLPPLDSNIQEWVDATNYPFDADANRTSTTNVLLPLGMFREFNITAPAGDQPTNDTSGLTYPVWISRAERTAHNAVRLFFATYNITDSSPDATTLEFATLDLVSTGETGDRIGIEPLNNLLLQNGTDADTFMQHLGRGHVTLSQAWASRPTDISTFFDAMNAVIDSPADISFSQASTKVSSFGISRIPKYTPTVGQSQALVGSSARLSPPVNPSDTNRYVTEADQGLGDKIDLESQTGITATAAIGRFGYTGSLAHRIVRLDIDGSQIDNNDTTFYEREVLPRLVVLLGRDPIFGDQYYNGIRFLTFNGNTWQD